MAVKGVVDRAQDTETNESLTVHVDRLAFSSPRLRYELVAEAYVLFDVAFRSISNSSLHELFGDGPVEHSRVFADAIALR